MARWKSLAADYGGMVLALVLILLVFGHYAPHFLTAQTFKTIASEIPDALFIAIGMTLVLIVAEIDLSVGSIVGLAGAVVGIALGVWHWPVYGAVGIGLAAGLVCGLINGFISARWAIPSFIVTLGMLEMARGAAYLVSHSQTQYVGGPIEKISDANVFGLSMPFILAVIAMVAAQIVLTRTVFGRYAVAIGTNEEAVRLSGIDPRGVKIKVFLISGVLSAVAAVIGVSRLASADPNAGSGYELQAIAAVVIGGTSLMGGRGSVIGSFFGVVIIALLENGLAQVGAEDPMKRLITGAVIIAAVVLDRYRGRARTV